MAGKSKSVFHDHEGREIVGYQFGMYFFDIAGAKNPKIRGLCGDSFASEGELLTAYDNTQQDVKLLRVYSDGSTVELRPKKLC